MARGRSSRSQNPMAVAAAAISRALDPLEPSRVTLLRLLSDAIRLLDECQASINDIGESGVMSGLLGLSKDAFVSGAQALAAAAFTCLMRLGARGGPLRGRSVTLLRRAGAIAGQKFIAQAASDARAHISSLKREPNAARNTFEADLASALLVLAEASSVDLSGVQSASQSVLFLVSAKAKQRVARGDLALAAAHIMSTFTLTDPPPANVLDRALEFALASASSKLGVGGIGSALLAASVVPFVRDKGDGAYDLLVSSAARALKVSPTHSECGVWAITIARGTFGKELATWRSRNPILSAPSSHDSPEERVGSDIVAFSVFESSLVNVAKIAGLRSGSDGCTCAMAGVLRMWALADSERVGEIPARVVSLLKGEIVGGETLVCTREAVVSGIWDQFEPRHARAAVNALIHLERLPDPAFALALILSAELVRLFDVDAIADMHRSDDAIQGVFSKCYIALGSRNNLLRHGAVCLVSSISSFAPHLRAPLITGLLQNLRIADMQLAMKPNSSISLFEESRSGSQDSELSALLGNAAALAAVAEEISLNPPAAPAALMTQCTADAEALLRPHGVSSSIVPDVSVLANIRRRIGWTLLTALARSGLPSCFTYERVHRLQAHWRDELGHSRSEQEYNSPNRAERGSKSEDKNQDGPGGAPSSFSLAGLKGIASYSSLDIEMMSSKSAARAASLIALAQCMRSYRSPQFDEIAGVLIGVAAARISADDAGVWIPGGLLIPALPIPSTSSFLTSTPKADSFSTYATASSKSQVSTGSVQYLGTPGQVGSTSKRLQPSLRPHGKDRTPRSDVEPNKSDAGLLLAQLRVIEAECLLDCILALPPSGSSATLCYHVASAMAEEAQRCLGEHGASSFGVSAVQSRPVFGIPSTRAAGDLERSHIAVQRRNLGGRRQIARIPCWQDGAREVLDSFDVMRTFVESRQRSVDDKYSGDLALKDLMWLFTPEGCELPLAESLLVKSAHAIAALVSKELAVSGSILESLMSTADLSPALCASVALALTRLLSPTEFSAAGRELASLQVLLRRALTGITMPTPNPLLHAPVSTTGAVSSTQNRQNPQDDNGLVGGAPCSLNERPGRFLESQIHCRGWQHWARSFSLDVADRDDESVSKLSRVFNLSSATRILTTEAYSELAGKGGPMLWLGITSGINEILHENLGRPAASSVSTIASAVSVLGELLTYIPTVYLQSSTGIVEGDADPVPGGCLTYSQDVAAIIGTAVDGIVGALRHRDVFVRASAATALSDSSLWVASNSGRFMPELLTAWASDRSENEISATRHTHMEEHGLYSAAFDNIAQGIFPCLPESEEGRLRPAKVRFFVYDAQGPRNCAGAFGMGAAAVVSACRQHWQTLSEACAGACGDIASDLLEWSMSSSPRTVAAGLYCLASLWAARIDLFRAESVASESGRHKKMTPLKSRSPRTLTSQHAKSVPSSPMIMRISEELEFSNDDDIQDVKGGFVPLEAFVVADVPLENTIGRIFECLRISGREAHHVELRTGAVAAMTQMIRGAGAGAALQKIPDLPWSLFLALDSHATGAGRVLEYLARVNGYKQLDYWIRLCRAIYFETEFDSQGKTVVKRRSVRSRTKTHAVAIARIVIEAVYSAAESAGIFCDHGIDDDPLSTCSRRCLDRGGDLRSEELHERHGFAQDLLKCLPSVLNLASEACLHVKYNPAAAEEGCNLMAAVNSTMARFRPLYDMNDADLVVHRSLVAAALRATIQSSCPPGVVKAAFSCLSRLLSFRTGSAPRGSTLASEALKDVLFLEGEPELVLSRYAYDIYSEEIGTDAILCILSQFASVCVTARALNNERQADALVTCVRLHRNVLYSLFGACVADFAAVLGNGAIEQGTMASSVSAPQNSSQNVTASFMRYIGFIACGAASLILDPAQNAVCEPRENAAVSIDWSNPRAPGSLLLEGMISGNDKISVAGLALSVIVWVLSCQGTYDFHESACSVHQRADFSTTTKEIVLQLDEISMKTSAEIAGWREFQRLVSIALPILLADSNIPIQKRVEALMSLRSANAETAIRVCRSLAITDLRVPDRQLLLNHAVALCIDELTNSLSSSKFVLVFDALSLLLPSLEPIRERTMIAGSVLDVLLFLVNLPPSVDIRCLADTNVQRAMRKILEICLGLLSSSRTQKILQALTERLERSFSSEASERLSILTCFAACLGILCPVPAVGPLVHILTASETVFESLLLSHGGVEFIAEALLQDSAVHVVLKPKAVSHIWYCLLCRLRAGREPIRRAVLRVLQTLVLQTQADRRSEAVLSVFIPALMSQDHFSQLEVGNVLSSVSRKYGSSFKTELAKLSVADRKRADAALCAAARRSAE